MAGLIDGNMVDEPCNCNAKSLREDKTCHYGGNCRKKMAIYGLKDSNTNKTYYGKTVQHLKKRAQQHFSDVWKIIDSKLHPNDMEKKRKAMATDSFANYFAQICGNCTNSNHVREKLKQDISVAVIWQGDSVKCTKSARTRDCRLCMVERKQIMQALRDDKHKVIITEMTTFTQHVNVPRDVTSSRYSFFCTEDALVAEKSHPKKKEKE